MQAAAGDAAAGGAGGAPRLVVFGGNGFVGSRITEEAVRTGLPVVSISRRGTPPPGVNASWTSQVEWAKACPSLPRALHIITVIAAAAIRRLLVCHCASLERGHHTTHLCSPRAADPGGFEEPEAIFRPRIKMLWQMRE